MGATRVRKSIEARRKQGRICVFTCWVLSLWKYCQCQCCQLEIGIGYLHNGSTYKGLGFRVGAKDEKDKWDGRDRKPREVRSLESEVWSPKSKTLPLVVLTHHVSDVARHRAKSTYRRPIAASRRGNRSALGQRAMPSAAIRTERAGEDISDTLVAGRGNPVENADARRTRFQTSGNSG